MAKFIIGLIQVRTVNFSEIACVLIGKAKEESNYKRIVRFFRFFEVCYKTIALLIVKMVGIEKPWVIVTDRTEWGYGKSWINILTLGIAYKGVAFPICWKILNKKGNSNTEERIELIEEFISIFGVNSIKFIAADREFIGQKFFSYLIIKKIDFRIRIKENTKVNNGNGGLVEVRKLFAHLAINSPLVLKRKRPIWSISLYLTGMRLQDGQYLILVAPQFAPNSCNDYLLRWNIETLFGSLKSKGFCLEESHLSDSIKLKKLIAVLSIAFSWAFLVGIFLSHHKPIKIKKHSRLSKSIFRFGFDHLRRFFSSSLSLLDTLVYNLLSST